MQNWITDMMEQFGYVGIFLMMTLENLFPPIPSEIVLPFAGFLTTYTNLTIFGVTVVATTGSVIGAIMLYGIGMLVDVQRLERIVDRWGHLLRLKKHDIYKADAWFDSYGYWTVLFCRMIPIVRSLISIPAGMSKMRFWLFLLFTIIGTVIWNIFLIMAGVILGASWGDILRFMDVYSTAVYKMLSAGIILFIILFIRKKAHD